MVTWISTGDALPESGECVLVRTRNPNPAYFDVCYFTKGEVLGEHPDVIRPEDKHGNNTRPYNWHSGRMQYFGQDVTHWAYITDVDGSVKKKDIDGTGERVIPRELQRFAEQVEAALSAMGEPLKKSCGTCEWLHANDRHGMCDWFFDSGVPTPSAMDYLEKQEFWMNPEQGGDCDTWEARDEQTNQEA